MEKPGVVVSVDPVSEAPTTTHRPTSGGFFSWIRDEETRHSPIKAARTVPWLGMIGLAGSFLSIYLSFSILRAIDGRETWPVGRLGSVMQPASWLSAIISANSIFLHLAMSEGLTVAWWFRATRKNATIQDLHRIWSTGTSTSSAVRDIRSLNYVSLATLFVAVIPLNGFLLQGALSTPIRTHTKNVTLDIPSVKQLPKGYSGWINDEGGIGTELSIWPVIWQQVTNGAGSDYAKYAYFGREGITGKKWKMNEWFDLIDSKLYHDDTAAVWKARVPGAGFDYSCSASTAPYNGTATNESQTLPVFDSRFEWDSSDPNTIYFNVYWKQDNYCVGQYQVRNCTLKAATVEYPVQLELNVSKAASGPFYSLQPTTTRHDDKVIEVLRPYPNEGKGNTTYGGIKILLDGWFGGNVLAENYTQNSGGSVTYNRPFGRTLGPNYWGDILNPGACGLNVLWGLQDLGYFKALNQPNRIPAAESGWYFWDETAVDIADVVLGQVRQSMFLSSIYSGSQWMTSDYVPNSQLQLDSKGNIVGWWVPGLDQRSNYIQTVNATRIHENTTYEVRWYLWGASVALTYLIILVILPTFWGFWVLSRKPTLSPIDVARAFDTQVLVTEDHGENLQVNQLLRRVGTRPLRDPSSSAEGPPLHYPVSPEEDSRPQRPTSVVVDGTTLHHPYAVLEDDRPLGHPPAAAIRSSNGSVIIGSDESGQRTSWFHLAASR